MFIVDHYIASAILAAVLGFLVKFVWDRWFSQASRVTREEFLTALNTWARECEIRRTGCMAVREQNKSYFSELIEDQACNATTVKEAKKLEDDLTHDRRIETRKALICIMMIQIKMCEALKIDCSDLARMIVEMGGID